jgi:hypothetical protein
MAEVEVSALAEQCLDRRIGDMDMFKKEVTIWTPNVTRHVKPYVGNLQNPMLEPALSRCAKLKNPTSSPGCPDDPM